MPGPTLIPRLSGRRDSVVLLVHKEVKGIWDVVPLRKLCRAAVRTARPLTEFVFGASVTSFYHRPVVEFPVLDAGDKPRFDWMDRRVLRQTLVEQFCSAKNVFERLAHLKRLE